MDQEAHVETLTTALARGRLLVVWGEMPWPPTDRLAAARALTVAGWKQEAAALAPIGWPLVALPPVPVLSLDPSDRLERAFRGAGLPVQVTRGRRQVRVAGAYTLLQLGGDLGTRRGLLLTWEDVTALRADPDKTHLLAEAARACDGGAALALMPGEGMAFQRVWEAAIAPALGQVPVFGLGPGPWPPGVVALEAAPEALLTTLAAVSVPQEADITMEPSHGEYDLFLSHNSDDKPLVELLARRLRTEGLQIWLDSWSLIPGEPWQEALEEGLDRSRTAVIAVGPAGIGPWQNEEMRVVLDRRAQDRGFRVIPLLLPGADLRRQPLPAFLRRFTWVDFRRGLGDAEALRRLLAGVRGRPPGPGDAEVTPHAPAPSVGDGTERDEAAISRERDLDTAVIRELVRAAFNDEELTTFCYDHFRPVYEDFTGGMSKGQKIHRLLDYCERQVQMERLLELIEEYNPAQYSRFNDRLR